MVNIKNLPKALVLKALFDASHQQGMGFLDSRGKEQMSIENAKTLTSDSRYLQFDYVFGRVLKIDISGDEFDERLYDRDNGYGAAEHAIRNLRNRIGIPE